MSEYRNNVASAVSGTPGTGTITLGAAVTGAQSFPSAYAASVVVPGVFLTDGNAWEVARNCAFDRTAGTLTRGTLEASSTGAVLALTSQAVVRVAASADTARRWDAAALGQFTVTGTTGAITAEVNRVYVAAMSAWTADRTLTLPAVCQEGDRVGVIVQAGSAAFELLVTAATGGTLNGVAGGTEWSRVFITGETLIMRCVVANSAWIVEQNGRKFEAFRVQTAGTTASHTRNTATKISAELSSVAYDVAGIWSVANRRFQPRRPGRYLIHGHHQMANLSASQTSVAQIFANGTTLVGGGGTASTVGGFAFPEADVVLALDVLNPTDFFELFVFYTDTADRLTNNANVYFEAARLPDLS